MIKENTSMGVVRQQVNFGNVPIVIETGKIATQANGSVMVSMGESIVLVTVTGNKSARPGIDFLPLTCEYIEKKYAAGKIPGGYFKRESRPGPLEILNARLIDRPMRPLFPKAWRGDVQIIATVLSYDQVNDPAIAAIVGASAATCLSQLPFDGPAAACRVILKDDQYLINPSMEEQKDARLNLIVAATADAVTMVEGEGDEASEQEMLDAILTAHQAMKPVIKMQNQLAQDHGKEKWHVPALSIDAPLFAQVVDLCIEDLDATLPNNNKDARKQALKKIEQKTIQSLVDQDETLSERQDEIKGYIAKVYRSVVRNRVVETKERMDGRKLHQVRPIWCEVGTLPRTHGSAIFTRGETQALATVTLGNKRDEQRIDALDEDYFEPFMLHYNFPPFCTGEAKPLRGTSRREIGHGNLAQRGVRAILPDHDDFSYTIRLVSEVLESNGSSSMATVCASSMALMHAGVPTRKQVAGIAMGLIEEGQQVAVLSDILGDEDHLGDMDFKVVGTQEGITAIQMDIKIKGLKRSILEQALEQARKGRLHILREMNKTIKCPADELTQHAPRIVKLQVNPDRVRDIIGPGGRTIRGLSEITSCTIDIDDSGTVTITGVGQEKVSQACQMIEQLTEEPEIGVEYEGVIRKIADFGLFVEIIPGREGLLHVSEIGTPRGSQLSDFFSEGENLSVRCIEITRDNKIRLTLVNASESQRATQSSRSSSDHRKDSQKNTSRSDQRNAKDSNRPVQSSRGDSSRRSDRSDRSTEQTRSNKSADRNNRKSSRDTNHGSSSRSSKRDQVQVGKQYEGVVKRVMDYGVFIEFLPDIDGLAHISRIQGIQRTQIHDHFVEGDELLVSVLEIDDKGRISLGIEEDEVMSLADDSTSVDKSFDSYDSDSYESVDDASYEDMQESYDYEEEVEEVEVGKVYLGTVTNIKSFGAFIEIAPDHSGLVHISELADHRIDQIEDIVEVGEEIYVKCIGINNGKIRLSRREALTEV